MEKLTIHKGNLPTKIEDLTKFVLVGREKLIAVRAEIRAIDKLGLAKEVRELKRDEAGFLADALLDAESKIGSLLNNIPKTSGARTDLQPLIPDYKRSKQQQVKELGFTNIQTSQFQQLADHPDIVEQIKTEARENDDLPTRTAVLKEIKLKERKERNDNLVPTELPEGEYDIILADPPWRYEYSNTKIRDIENKYPTMELEEIKNMELPSADNCILFLWATAPKLPEALEVLNAWGFTYRTCAVWDKEIIGMGYWFRGQHELLLVGVKGEFSPPEQSKRVSSVYKEKRGKHSSKPDYYYNLIEECYPNGKYLELFARKKHNDKWSVYGNEIE